MKEEESEIWVPPPYQDSNSETFIPELQSEPLDENRSTDELWQINHAIKQLEVELVWTVDYSRSLET